MRTTGELVLSHLTGFDLKPEGQGQWRCNSPLRPGANSHSFTLRIDGDGEHGAFDDKAGGESGSLYALAQRLGIDLPKSERPQVEDSKRAYKNLAEYAALKGIPEAEFIKAKWSPIPVTYANRPALEFLTQGGKKRYRFVDGLKPAFMSETGYKACWYGIASAASIANSNDWPLIICNGEPSVIVAQYHRLPACAITGGEQPTIPAALLEELKAKWTGPIVLAMDCDEAGRKSANGKAAILRGAGYVVHVIDLGLGDKGDLADFCKLYTDQALTRLLTLIKPVETSQAVKLSIPVTNRSERLTSYYNRLTDFEAPRDSVPVPFPLKALHPFGGMAQILKPGKMLGIVGLSGGGKTSLLETMVDSWLNYHVPCLVWSPEWTPDEFIERAVQRYGGPRTDEVYRHEIFIDEHQRGIKDGFGVELSPPQLQSASTAIRLLRAFTSEVGYLDMPTLTVPYLQSAIENTLQQISFKPRVLVLDYVQLLSALEPGNTSMYDLLMRVKIIGNTYGLIPVVACQVTKSSAKSQQTGKVLDAMDARFVNDDAFNLFITINPDRDKDGSYYPSSVLNVAKNSMGLRGKMRVATDWSRLSFDDKAHPNQVFEKGFDYD